MEMEARVERVKVLTRCSRPRLSHHTRHVCTFPKGAQTMPSHQARDGQTVRTTEGREEGGKKGEVRQWLSQGTHLYKHI